MRAHGVRIQAAVAAGILGVGVLATSTLASQTAAGATPAANSNATEPVIVVLADQLGATPPDATHQSQRAVKAHAAQSTVLSRVSGRKPTAVKNFSLSNAFSATVTVAQAAALAQDPAVASVTVDRPVEIAPQAQAAATATKAAATASGAATVDPSACSADPTKPKLEPEALSTIGARSDDPTVKTAASLGIDGTGVKVAFIADGINPANPGFARTNGKSSIVDYQDFYGDGLNAPTSGAEAFGDASAISAQGNVVYDVADYSNPSVVSYPGGHCYIKVVGVAPGADVVALKAGSELLPNSAILQAIEYAVTTAHVDVLSESFGANILPDSGARNTIQLFDDAAVAAGTTVTVSTGDAGTTGTIGNPSTDPNVISTGASTDSRIYEQTGYALATKFGNGKWQDDNISSLSSAGITQTGRTVDVSAPGEADWALCDDSGNFSGCASFQGTYSKIQSFGGTSQSAPITAGVAALVIQAYKKAHAGTAPTPAVVKQIITSTSDDLGFDGTVQGSGRIDARSAVEAALTWPGAKTPAPAGTLPNIALTANQGLLEGAPGSTVSGTVGVTNVGSTPITVLPATRKYASLGLFQDVVPISAASKQTVPYPTTGLPWAYTTETFTVPAGADVLDTSIRWQSGALTGDNGPVVRLSLFAPDGTYAANTRPQGGAAPANYGDTLVRKPAAGVWTAVLYTAQTGGFTGNVTLTANPQRALPVGTLSTGAFTLNPGQTKAVTASFAVPTIGGDTSYTVSLATSAGRQVAIPVIVRSIVPLSTGSGAFAGTITGGNARAYSPAQSFAYEFDVPKGQRDLLTSVTLATDAGDLLQGTLVDPNGETPSIATNQDPTTGLYNRSLQNIVAAPIPGRWRYVVIAENPVSGAHLTQNFAGSVKLNQVTASVSTLLTTGGLTLAPGRKFTATVSVRNPGPAPILVQTDARLPGSVSLQLAPQFAGSTFTLPLDVEELSAVPAYLVPPDTQQLSLSAASTTPAQVELDSPGGGIDVFGDLAAAQGGNTISTATVHETAPATVGQGIWSPYVQQIGPFGLNGAPAGSTTLSASVITAPFDTSVTSTAGDPYVSSTDTTADPGTGVKVAPGATVTITLTIQPPTTAKKGSLVSGTLHLVTTPLGSPAGNTTGDIIANLPYKYRVAS